MIIIAVLYFILMHLCIKLSADYSLDMMTRLSFFVSTLSYSICLLYELILYILLLYSSIFISVNSSSPTFDFSVYSPLPNSTSSFRPTATTGNPIYSSSISFVYPYLFLSKNITLFFFMYNIFKILVFSFSVVGFISLYRKTASSVNITSERKIIYEVDKYGSLDT